jgi:hypothetical protein
MLLRILIHFLSDSERIIYYTDSDANTDFLDVGNDTVWTGDGAEADFFKSDNMCLRVVFYDEKQFINQSHKAAIQHEIITINPPL